LANHTRLVLAKPFHVLEIGLKFWRDSNYVHKFWYASSSTKSGHTQHMNISLKIPPMKDLTCSYCDLIATRVMYLHLPNSASCCCLTDLDADMVMCLQLPPLVVNGFWA
jgi:hypothetical protein